MQTPHGLDLGDVETLVAALRGPQPVRLAGDVVQLPVIPQDTAGPSAPTLEAQRQLLGPRYDAVKSETNLRAVPRETILKWLASPASQGRVYNPPPMVTPPLRVSPPLLGGPDMPPGVGGSPFPPRL